MTPSAKHRMQIAEEAIHGILKPLGFKKQKTHWRRKTSELLQQFTLDKMTVGDAHYQPEWGMSLLRRLKEPNPPYYKLDVRWMGGYRNDPDQAKRYWYAFKFGDPPSKADLDAMIPTPWAAEARALREKYDVLIPDEERVRLITDFLHEYVLPCFEAFTTEATLLQVPQNGRHPLHPTLMSGILDLIKK